MSFFNYPSTNLSMMPNLECYQNYTPSYSPIFPLFPQYYSDMMQFYNISQSSINWASQPKIQNSCFQTSEGSSELEVVLPIQNTQKNGKRVQKKQNADKQILSAKKNSESNIVNQFYSFFAYREKSEKIVFRALEATLPNTEFGQKIVLLFYNTIRAINAKRGRKYVNRSMLLSYFTPELLIENLPEIQEKLKKISFISIDDLCQIFRRCCQAFLKTVSIPAILTSKRIVGISKQQHLKKTRKILKAISGY